MLADSAVVPKVRGIHYYMFLILDERSQSLFFSATLDLHSNSTQIQALRKYMKHLSQRGNPEVIMTNDVPSRRQDQNILPSGLKLYSVVTRGDHEKEEFLYYYGKQFSGRTLVFFNSIRKYVDEQISDRCGEACV